MGSSILDGCGAYSSYLHEISDEILKNKVFNGEEISLMEQIDTDNNIFEAYQTILSVLHDSRSIGQAVMQLKEEAIKSGEVSDFKSLAIAIATKNIEKEEMRNKETASEKDVIYAEMVDDIVEDIFSEEKVANYLNELFENACEGDGTSAYKIELISRASEYINQSKQIKDQKNWEEYLLLVAEIKYITDSEKDPRLDRILNNLLEVIEFKKLLNINPEESITYEHIEYALKNIQIDKSSDEKEDNVTNMTSGNDETKIENSDSTVRKGEQKLITELLERIKTGKTAKEYKDRYKEYKDRYKTETSEEIIQYLLISFRSGSTGASNRKVENLMGKRGITNQAIRDFKEKEPANYKEQFKMDEAIKLQIKKIIEQRDKAMQLGMPDDEIEKMDLKLFGLQEELKSAKENSNNSDEKTNNENRNTSSDSSSSRGDDGDDSRFDL